MSRFSPPLGFRNLVLIAGLAAAATITPAVALEVNFPQQCFNVPKDSATLGTDPIWLSFCQPAGKTCVIRAAPQVDASFDVSGATTSRPER